MGGQWVYVNNSSFKLIAYSMHADLCRPISPHTSLMPTVYGATWNYLTFLHTAYIGDLSCNCVTQFHSPYSAYTKPISTTQPKSFSDIYWRPTAAQIHLFLIIGQRYLTTKGETYQYHWEAIKKKVHFGVRVTSAMRFAIRFECCSAVESLAWLSIVQSITASCLNCKFIYGIWSCKVNQ